MRKELLLLMFLFGCVSLVNGQKRWQKLGVVHDDGTIKVELELYTPQPNNSCQTGKLFKYKYKLTGRYHDQLQYLNWKLDYIDCNGSLYEKSVSLKIGGIRDKDISGGVYQSFFDESFPARSIEQNPYGFTKANKEVLGNKFVATPKSTDPNRVLGPNLIKRGQSTILTVEGGRLGIGAKWIWYEGENCMGKEIGTGRTIEVQPDRLTTYTVKAVGKYNETNCFSKTVDLDDRSYAPDKIAGSPNICKGESATLSISGGTLGLNAGWVWYEKACGGKPIGRGTSLTVKPSKPTSYFVRAEGGLNTTNCSRIDIRIFEKSTAPKSIQIIGKEETLCAGESITLNVNGGQLAPGATWMWYEDGCQGKYLGKGSSITVSPRKTTTYHVKGVGDCHATACASVEIPVYTSSLAPARIQTDKNFFDKGESVTLTINGGRLGASASWIWTKGSCESNTQIGTGNSITVSPKSKATYHVKAVGGCSNTECTKITLAPTKKRNWGQFHEGKEFMHYGVGIGLDFFQVATPALFTESNLPGITDTAIIHGSGIVGEVWLHPVITEYFTLGLKGGAKIGTTPLRFFRNISTDDFRYFYTGLNFGGEVAVGIPAGKILAQFDKQVLYNNFRRFRSDDGEVTLDENLRTERLGFGFRIGRYNPTSSYKRGSIWDVTYILSRNSYSRLNILAESNPNLKAWNRGLSVAWWAPNLLRISGSVSFAEPGSDFRIRDINLRAAYYQGSILIYLNRFY
ncbi:MAG: hypothetical protein AAF705_09605 [Bacteroidota bacterium]